MLVTKNSYVCPLLHVIRQKAKNLTKRCTTRAYTIPHKYYVTQKKVINKQLK